MENTVNLSGSGSGPVCGGGGRQREAAAVSVVPSTVSPWKPQNRPGGSVGGPEREETIKNQNQNHQQQQQQQRGGGGL